MTFEESRASIRPCRDREDDALNVIELIEEKGGRESLETIADSVGLSFADVSKVADLLSPLMIQKLNRHMGNPSGRNWIRRQRDGGGPQQFIDRPLLMSSSAVSIDGGRLLSRLVGKHSIVELVSLHLAQRTQLDAKKIQRLLPGIAVLFVGALCKGLAPSGE